MVIENLKNIGLKIKENDFEQYRNMILEQEKMRKKHVKNLDRYLKIKELFPSPINVRIKKLGKKKGLDIWLVDGPKIRQQIDIDFTMGGHGLRYLYVPLNEIWIDSVVENDNDLQPTIYHELTEFSLMKTGLSYNEAHTIASVVESIQRENIAKRNGNNNNNMNNLKKN